MRSRPPCGSTLKTWTVALGLCVPGLALQATERTHLRLALHDSIRTVDPRQTVDENSRSIEDLIHCSLMQRDADGQLVPGLAAKDPQWKSPKILEVTVKAGVKFSDGSAVTANDVAATYHALVTDKALARSRSFHQVTAVQAQGETVSFTLHEPDASFIGNLVVGILPAKLAKTRTIDPIQSPSCGPYHMKSHEWNSIILKENPHYAGSPKLRLKQIEIRFSLDEKIRLAQLQAGELDLVQNGISLP
ncbi:MAG: ABC transporter substrate-binding protein, partial [Pseudobdellovibrionaceae bacterium]|nr:ABC transporter substrate-binding protein [Pseudobdellovibrionaceae bacterium]